MNRRVYGMEISPKYCGVIVKRWLALGEDRKVIRNGKDVTASFLPVENLQGHIAKIAADFSVRSSRLSDSFSKVAFQHFCIESLGFNLGTSTRIFLIISLA